MGMKKEIKLWFEARRKAIEKSLKPKKAKKGSAYETRTKQGAGFWQADIGEKSD